MNTTTLSHVAKLLQDLPGLGRTLEGLLAAYTAFHKLSPFQEGDRITIKKFKSGWDDWVTSVHGGSAGVIKSVEWTKDKTGDGYSWVYGITLNGHDVCTMNGRLYAVPIKCIEKKKGRAKRSHKTAKKENGNV